MDISDLYTRKSTRDDGRSVASQETDWRADCERERLRPGRVFSDPDLSASRHARKPRPDYEQLVAYVAGGQCRVLSLWEASRGSRKLSEWVDLLDLCRQQGTLIRVISHNRTYDVSVRRDWRTLADEGVDAQDESERISERIRRDKRTQAAAGKPLGKLAYGFTRKYELGKLVEQLEHPTRGPIVREIADRIIAGDTLQSIAATLNDRGEPSPGGSVWDGSHIPRLIRNPAYIGQSVHQRQVIGEATWPPILTEETYYRVLGILGNPDRRTQRGTEMRWWLAGALLCDACEQPLSPINQPTKTGRVRRWACHTRKCGAVTMTAHPMEDWIEAAIDARLHSADAAKLFDRRSDDKAAAAARGELKTLQDRLDAHYAMSAAGQLSEGGIAKVEALLLPQIARAKENATRLELPPNLRRLAGLDIAKVWRDEPPRVRRDLAVHMAELRIMPAARRGQRGFDQARLRRSRWRNDHRTWGELWATGAVMPGPAV